MKNIFENMTQSVHDELCLDEEYKIILDQESKQIGKSRIEESFARNDWMSPDEFGNYLKGEIKRVYDAITFDEFERRWQAEY